MNSINTSSCYTYKNPTIRRLGYAVWIVFTILSFVFYKERSAFMDGGFQLFDLINTESFSIHHYRITNPLTQIFALIGVKLGLPLKYIMLGYSVNFIAFHFIIYHIIIKWCKNDFLALVQIGFFTLFVTQSFYFLPPEFYQGMSILLLWFAILLNQHIRNSIWKFLGLSVLLIPIIFDHALLSLFFLFIWLFLWFHDKKLRNRNYYGLLVIMIVVYVIHDLYFTGWYDLARKEHFWRHWNLYFPKFNLLPANDIFWNRCLDTYYLFPLLLLTVIIGYIKAHISTSSQIKFPLLKLVLITGFCFFYILINHINDPKTPFLFYSQVNYIGLAIPIMVAIGFDFLPIISHKKNVIYSIAAIILLRIFTIVDASSNLKQRHNWMLKTIKSTDSNKVVINRTDIQNDLMIQVWSTPEETLLLSSLDGPKSAATLLIKMSNYKFNDALDSNNMLLRTHSVQPLQELNSKYFDLSDEHYQKAEMTKDD